MFFSTVVFTKEIWEIRDGSYPVLVYIWRKPSHNALKIQCILLMDTCTLKFLGLRDPNRLSRDDKFSTVSEYIYGTSKDDKFYGDSQKLASQVTFLTICIQQPKQRSQLKPHSYIRYQHTIFTYQFLVLHYSGEYY